MVDLLNVNALPEAGDWPETVPQLENGWYPTGGVVDPANDEGLLNWPNRELAIRTRILRDRVDALMVKAGKLEPNCCTSAPRVISTSAASDVIVSQPRLAPATSTCSAIW